MNPSAYIAHEAPFGSQYLAHLAALAKEASERMQGVPPFKVMVALAVIVHLCVLVPVYFLVLPEDVPESKQVRLAFGVDKNKKKAAMQQKQQGLPSEVGSTMDGMLAPKRPQRTVRKQRETRVQAPVMQDQSRTSTSQRSVSTQSRPSQKSSSMMQRPSGAATPNVPRGRTAGRGQQSVAQSEVKEVMVKYERLLSGWIHSHQSNQNFSLPKGLKGRVVVRVRINRKGFVTRKTVEQSSGYAELDRAAIDAVTQASPVPAVPDAYPGGAQLEFLIPISIVVR